MCVAHRDSACKIKGGWLTFFMIAMIGFGFLAGSGEAEAGLVERLKAKDTGWLPNKEAKPVATPATEEPEEASETKAEKKTEPAPQPSSIWIRKPTKKKYLDPRIEPQLLIRAQYVTTQEDKILESVKLKPGSSEPDPEIYDSSSMPSSPYGHREGFVLENVELGLKGRFNDYGLYYGAKFELLPREKDGTQSSDYLKDAYMGWNYYTLADVRVGRMKVPFSQVNMKSTAKMPLALKPVINLLSPKRQLGAMVALSDPWGIFTAKGGVYNSVKIASEQLAKKEQLMYVGRAEWKTSGLLKALNTRMTAGDFRLTDFEFKLGGGVAYSEENYDPISEVRYTGVDAHLHWFIFTYEGELIFKDFYDPEDLDGNRAANRGWGWAHDLVIHAWPEIIDVAMRVETMDGDKEERGQSTQMDEVRPQKKLWISGGMTLHIADQALFMLNYVHRKEKEGFDYDNDVFVGMLQFSL